MRIKYIREFITLAKNLNFTKSAEQLYISQSVLSRHISFLEKELGIKLFKRNTQNVTLTDVGLFYLEHFQTLINKYDALCEEGFVKARGFNAELRIGLPYYVMDYYMGQVPLLLAKKHPEIMLTYLTGHPDQLIEALRKDKVNVLITSNMSNQYTGKYEFYELFNEPLSVLLPDSHPLAGQQRVTFSELSNETFLCVECVLFPNTWTYLRNLCLKNGFEPRKPIKFNQIESVALAIQKGQGIFVDGQCLYNLCHKGVTAIPLAGEGCYRRVSIVYKAENRNHAISTLISMFDRAISNGDWDIVDFAESLSQPVAQ